MKRRGPLRKDLLAGCSEPGPEDGIDPRTGFRLSRARVPNRKALQLAAQVRDILHELLSTGCGDDLLREVRVAEVAPAPHADHLRVTVEVPANGPGPDVIVARLNLRSGHLRTEVAAAICRRRAPRLSFVVITPTAG